MYKLLLRPLLFLVAPERIHRLTFNLLKLSSRVGLSQILKATYSFHDPKLVKELMGLRFKNPVGLAAGFDKDAKEIDELATLGFGFIEIGTLTPRPQTGNALPRLFRLPQDNALINRMGFNNEGVEAAAERLKKSSADVLIGGNIGKNKDTPNDRAGEDYSYCFDVLYPYVDYFVVNVSSPNTPNLRDLQEKEPLRRLLTQVKNLSRAKEKPKPVLLKISPDLTTGQLDDVIAILRETGTDGVIATNTTLSREGLSTQSEAVEEMGAGGLSGRPLAKKSNEIIAYLRKELGRDYPIIGVGGILSPADAIEKFKAGADVIQVYTGFIYEGPGFVKKILKEYLRR